MQVYLSEYLHKRAESTIQVEEKHFQFSNIPLVNLMFQFTAKQFNGQPNFVIANIKEFYEKVHLATHIQSMKAKQQKKLPSANMLEIEQCFTASLHLYTYGRLLHL